MSKNLLCKYKNEKLDVIVGGQFYEESLLYHFFSYSIIFFPRDSIISVVEKLNEKQNFAMKKDERSSE